MTARAQFGARAYPGKVAIRHAVEAARELGLDVAGFEVSPDGRIKILDARAVPKAADDEFDRLEKAGLL